jgi:hypothetical protein
VSRYKADDITQLVPSFRVLVEQLLELMKADGFDPIVRDAYRTHAEAQANLDAGVGIADSMHCYRVAADIIDAERGWAHPEFFEALHKHALALGLTRVRRRQANGKRVWDQPHVQAIPVSLQAAVRAAKTVEAVDAICAKHLAKAA